LRWLAPWGAVSDAAAFVDELHRECGLRHPLRGVAVSALASREDTDDVLFRLEDGSGRVAVVHLTWRKESGPDWPHATILPDLAAFAEKVMAKDHAGPGA
jgi:hypothetical protein